MKYEREKPTIEVCKKRLGLGFALIICFLGLQAILRASGKNGTNVKAPLTAEQVASRMAEMNQHRTEALRSYTSLRSYHLELHGMINIHADMDVKMTYHYPGQKSFTILSQSGSAFMRSHVLKRLLRAETKTSLRGEHRQIAITPHNYNFQLAGYENNAQGGIYILDVTPKVNRRYLLKGRVWVSGRNFSIVHIVGQPAKRVSWWTPKVNFVYDYRKVGGFWFPSLNKTITHVRVFGRSLLTIQYKDYELTDARSVQPFKSASTAMNDPVNEMRLISPDSLR